MKRFSGFLLMVLAMETADVTGSPAEPEHASVNLLSLSLQIQPTTARDGVSSLEYHMSISSLENPNTVNNELAVSQNTEFTHQGFFVLIDPILFEPSVIPFVLDIPPFADTNTNEFNDFFEAVLPVEGVVTTGRHPDLFGGAGGEDFSATWTRASGESAGTVVMEIGQLGLTFTHPFNLLNYRGEFTFSRDGTNLSGNIAITNIFIPEDTMQGPLNLGIASSNQLVYAAGSWNGPDELVYHYAPEDPLDLIGPNFISQVTFEDGYSPTSEADYRDWLLIIDAKDENGDQIPDLVQPPAPPAPARLEIVKTPGGWELLITGTIGREYALESTATIGGGWEQGESFTLLENPTMRPVAPEGPHRFIRVREL